MGLRHPHKVSDSQINLHSIRTPGKKGFNTSMRKQQVLKGTSMFNFFFQLLYTSSGVFNNFTHTKPKGRSRFLHISHQLQITICHGRHLSSRITKPAKFWLKLSQPLQNQIEQQSKILAQTKHVNLTSMYHLTDIQMQHQFR